jgi:hypothetical protein
MLRLICQLILGSHSAKLEVLCRSMISPSKIFNFAFIGLNMEEIGATWVVCFWACVVLKYLNNRTLLSVESVMIWVALVRDLDPRLRLFGDVIRPDSVASPSLPLILNTRGWNSITPIRAPYQGQRWGSSSNLEICPALTRQYTLLHVRGLPSTFRESRQSHLPVESRDGLHVRRSQRYLRQSRSWGRS